LDKIASVTTRVGVPHEVEITTAIPAERGTVIVVQALEEKQVYGELELVGGQMAPISKGDYIATFGGGPLACAATLATP
jgi:hypothetical protein